MRSHGVKALLRSEVQKKLGLNVKQREEVRSIYEGMEKEIRKLLETPPADVRKAQELGKKLRKAHQDQKEDKSKGEDSKRGDKKDSEKKDAGKKDSGSKKE